MSGGNRILSNQSCEGLGLVEMHPVFGEGIGGTDCFQAGLYFESVATGKVVSGWRPVLHGAGKVVAVQYSTG